MFERFTRAARRVARDARAHARALGHDRIDTQHLLLGVLDDTGAAELLARWGVTAADVRAAVAVGDGDLDAGALAAVGVDLEAVQARVEDAFGVGALRRRSARPRRSDAFTPGAKAALELALREALALGDGSIGVEHVLLGVLAERTGPGARILVAHGVEAPALRAAVADLRAR